MRRIIFCSGAGISAAAGIPTFRDANGLWHNHKIEEVCNYSTWKENYSLVHDFYNQRRIDLADKTPTEAHKLIASLQRQYGADRIINITTNVDDLFEKAYALETFHLHGEIGLMELNHSRVRDLLEDPVRVIGEFDYSKYPDAKPSVVFFGENAPMYGKLWNVAANITPDDMVVIIGSSEQVVDFYCEFYRSLNTVIVNPVKHLSRRYESAFTQVFEMGAENFAISHGPKIFEGWMSVED